MNHKNHSTAKSGMKSILFLILFIAGFSIIIEHTFLYHNFLKINYSLNYPISNSHNHLEDSNSNHEFVLSDTQKKGFELFIKPEKINQDFHPHILIHSHTIWQPPEFL